MNKGPISQFMQKHYLHFNAAAMMDAAKGYEAHMNDGGKMMITLAGAMSTGELGISLAEMIRQDKVQIISCTGANLEVIIPPVNGHGYEPMEELYSYRLMIHFNFNYNETNFIQDISYRRIGIIVNPYVSGTSTILNSDTATGLHSITFTSTDGNYEYGEQIYQQTTGALGRVVSWDYTTNILKYTQDRFTSTTNGILKLFSGTGAVSGLSSGVSGVPNMTTYSNPDIEKNSGQILYIGNRKAIVRSSSQIEDVKVVVEF